MKKMISCIYRITFLLSCFFIFISIMNMHSALSVKNYIETTGVISEVESKEHLSRQGKQTRFSYIITWEKDGKEYQKRVKAAFSKPDEGINVIWVRPDNKDAILSNSVSIRVTSYFDLIVGIVLGVVAVLFRKKGEELHLIGRQEYMEHLHDKRILLAILLGCDFFMVFIVGLMHYSAWKNGEYIPAPMMDLIILGVFFAGVIGLKLQKISKEISK